MQNQTAHRWLEDVREDGLYNGNKDHLLNLFKTLVISYMTKMVQIYYAF